MNQPASPNLNNPFPGLRAYDAQDAPWFFGRRTDIEGLQRRVKEARFVAVVGASGSGKSSIVRAGLLPSLEAATGASWRCAIFRPGVDPIGEAASALGSLTPPGARGLDPRSIETTLRRSSLGLVESIRSLSDIARTRVLVVVDQFDEVFRFKELTRSRDNGDEAVAFVNLLIEAARDIDTPTCIVITMRSDFLGRCEEFRGLPEAVSGGMYLIPRLTRAGLRAAIEGPVGRTHAEIAPRLVQRLLNDIDDVPDQLPVLQHALMRTWDRWRHTDPNRPLDLDDYEQIGGMREALSRHANSVWENLPDDAQREIARTMFKRLTERGRDGNETRRPTMLGEIAGVSGATLASVIDVVEAFRDPTCALVMAPPARELEASSVVDISHESLIRLWNRLREWISEEAEAADQYLRVAVDAKRHAEQRQSLYRDPELAAAVSLFTRINEPWAVRYHPGFQLATRFLTASREERDRAWESARVEEAKEAPSVARLSATGWDLWGPLRARYEGLARRGGPYRVLSLDGGGVRSIISLQVLEALESMLGRAFGRGLEFRLCDYFDMIGGTSTGAVVAAALARGMAVREVLAFFKPLLPEMFSKRSLLGRWKSLYDAAPLAQRLKELFGERTTLRPDDLKTLLVIVTKNATSETAWPVTSNPWAKFNDPLRPDSTLRIPLWQLVRGGTAAPAYFPPEIVRSDSHTPDRAFVIADGSSTPYKHPAFLLARIATEPAYRLAWPSGESRLLIVSIGSGLAPAAGRPADAPEENLMSGAISTLSGLMSTAQADQELSCRTIGRCTHGEPIDREVGDLIHRNPDGSMIPLSVDMGRQFLYVRYDTMLTAYGLAELGLSDIDPSTIQQLDRVESVDDLLRVGHQLAMRVSRSHLGSFIP